MSDVKLNKNILKVKIHSVVCDCGDGSAANRICKNEEDAKLYADVEAVLGAHYGYGFAESGYQCDELHIDLKTGEIINPNITSEEIQDQIDEYNEIPKCNFEEERKIF